MTEATQTIRGRLVGPNLLEVSSRRDDALIAHFKSMPGIEYTGNRTWIGGAETWAVLVPILEKYGVIEGMELDPSPSLPQAESRLDESGLFKYQVAGAAYIQRSLATTGGALLADEMGLGKTIQAIRALAPTFPKRILVVCPAIVVLKWLREIKKWCGEDAERLGRKLGKKEGGGRLLSWGRWAVVSHDTFRGLQAQIQDAADYVVVDEIHNYANSRSGRSKAMAAYVRRSKAEVIGLSGTPMTARPKDLHNPLDLIWPKRWGHWMKFTARYCDGHYEDIRGVPNPVWVSDGTSNEAELGARLQAMMLRRVKREVTDLPSRQRILLPVELPVRTTRALGSMPAANNTQLQAALDATSDYKYEAACQLVEELQFQGRKVLLLTKLKKTAYGLGELLGCVVGTGDDPPTKRIEKLSKASLAAATIDSVTTGIDLVNFDTVVFVGLDWVPATLLQAEARVHRLGQDQDVLIYYLIGVGTADEQVQAKVIERLDTFTTIVGNSVDESEMAHALRGGKSHEELIDDLFSSIMQEAS